jgi:hypothetical protein
MLKFEEDGHRYLNVDENDSFQWVSVTRLVEQFKHPFEKEKVALNCSKGKNPKYAGKDPKDILDAWDKENKRAIMLGSWYHEQRERATLDCNTITRDGIELPIINSLYEGKVKLAPEQTIVDGIYPEHLMYLRSASICGQADRVEVVSGKVDVYDYKTSKEIKLRGHQFYDGTRKMMVGPLRHLEDCEFNHYALQLSIYMYMILKYNYNLEPGEIEIHHITFEIESVDEYGYPVHATDPLGEPIIKKIEPLKLPYLKKEVITMLKWLDINKKQVLYNAHTTI